MMLAFRYAAQTHVGMVREKNDDSGYAGPNLLAVADGMGGVVGGDIASAITIEAVRSLDRSGHPDPLASLSGAVSDANARIARRIRTEPRLEGMGTTLTGGLLHDGDKLALVHIGDSFGYLLRDGELIKITKDHTFVQSLVDDGRLTEAQAKQHPHRALLVRAIQGGQDTDPDLHLHPLHPGDRLLFCSDGTEDIRHQDLTEVLQRYRDPSTAAEAVVRLALRSGTSDNVTCVLADVVRREEQPTPPTAGPIVVGAAGTVDLNVDAPTEATADYVPVGRPEPDLGADDDAPLMPGVGEPVFGAASASAAVAVEPDEDLDEEELRYAPRPPRRFRWLRRGLVAVVAAGLLAGGGYLAYEWTQQQYYVGVTPGTGEEPAGSEGGNQVAIYQGIAQSVPGLSLSSVAETIPVELAELPTFRREQVIQTIPARDLDHARQITDELVRLAEECRASGSAGESGQGGQKGSTGAETGKESQSASPSPTASPSQVATAPSGECAGVDDSGER